jgi:hypothetical protein
MPKGGPTSHQDLMREKSAGSCYTEKGMAIMPEEDAHHDGKDKKEKGVPQGPAGSKYPGKKQGE